MHTRNRIQALDMTRTRIKHLATKLIAGSDYRLAKSFYHLWFYLNSIGRPPLLVYQMGKVGSMTVYESLKDARLDLAIYHVHVLSKEGIRWEEDAYFGKSGKLFRKSGLPATFSLIQSHYLYKQLAKNNDGKWWKIVTLIRDPIARNVSSLFQIIERWFPDFSHRASRGAISTDELTEIFFHDLHRKLDPYELPFRWFSAELEPVFGIDVLSSEFSKSAGYKIYKDERVELLLIKVEELDRCFAQAIKEFLGVDVPLINANVASEKVYYSLYQDFLRALKLPDAYLEKMYSCKYVQHFYSESEISGFMRKWRKATTAG